MGSGARRFPQSSRSCFSNDGANADPHAVRPVAESQDGLYRLTGISLSRLDQPAYERTDLLVQPGQRQSLARVAQLPCIQSKKAAQILINKNHAQAQTWN